MLEKPIKTFHNLSLNVVLGAMLCSWMFTKLPNGDSKINYFVLSLLGIATWSIYLLDRLLDVRIYPIDFSERHEFHLRNKKALYVLLTVLLVSGGVLCFYIPKEVFFYGLTIALFIGQALNGDYAMGFLIVSGFYALLAIIIFVLRRPLVTNPVLRMMVDKLFKEEEEEG